MPGFGMILGGAMEGWSGAKLDEIKAEREARMQELEAQRQDKRIADEQSFRSKEAAIGRDFESGQNDKAIAARSDEAQKARDANGDLITDDQGNSYSRTGSTAKPLVDDKGKPIKATSGKVGDKPADVSTAEWLVQQHVAPDVSTAWKMVRSARNDPDKSRASLYKASLDALTKGAIGTPDPVELQKQAQDMTEKAIEYLSQEDSAADGSAKSGGSAGVKPGGVEGPGDVIPTDPAKRVIGKVYKSPSGKIAKWTGQGWELIQ